jgi:hypothetical protein
MRHLDLVSVKTLALFEKRFEGDDCLMELARARFVDVHMGAEMHAGTPEQLSHLLSFRPGDDAPVIVHLPRDFNLVDEQSQTRITSLARAAAGRIQGMVLHDNTALASRRDAYVAAAWKMETVFDQIAGCPMLFVEYAAGLEPGAFTGFFSAIRDLEHISACIDIGHVGIAAARAAFARKHGGEDVCALKSAGPKLASRLSDVEAAVKCGTATVLEVIETVSALQKRLHFHLHDGHPLSTFSPFGVSDHLSFFSEIPLSVAYNGHRALPLMFGPEGLKELVARAIQRAGPQRLSFTLEIHPTGERLALGDRASIFERWTDKTNAEKMNHWLSVLARNHELLREAIDSCFKPPDIPEPLADQAQVETGCGPCDI